MPVTPGPGGPSSLTALGFDDRWAALSADLPSAATVMRVISDHRGAVVASDGRHEIRVDTPHDLHPVAGDWIAVSDGRIAAILERVSAVVRRRPGGAPQVLAANIDLVGVLHGLDRPWNRRRLERGLVLAWESGATPVVVLTKADLADDVEEIARDASVTGPGVEVVVVSTVDGRGIDELRRLLQPNRTLALLGASGSGKSTLANALTGTESMSTQQVRAGDHKGRHTTSHRELLLVPGGGALLDTPGLRALTIGVADEGVGRTFPEIDELADGCRFTDCRHDHEPDCAVLAAVDAGVLDPDRFEGWRRVRREADSARLRADPVALRQRDRQWGRTAWEDAIRLKRGASPRRSRKDD